MLGGGNLLRITLYITWSLVKVTDRDLEYCVGKVLPSIHAKGERTFISGAQSANLNDAI